MKQSVKYSTYSIIITVIALTIMTALMIMQLKRGNILPAYLIAAITVASCMAALFYAPISVAIDDNSLKIKRSIRTKSIPLSGIEAIKICPPTMGERRLFGSGGLFGYWGWFSQRDIGRYFAYYGRSSECFLVRLYSGRQYVIGCNNPEAITETIKQKLSH